MPKKNVARARLRNQVAGGGVYHFTLQRTQRNKLGEVETPAGVVIQRKHQSKAKARLVTLDELVADKAIRVNVKGVQWLYVVTEEGLKLRPAARRKWKLLPWSELADKGLASDNEPDQFTLIPGQQTDNRFTGAKKL